MTFQRKKTGTEKGWHKVKTRGVLNATVWRDIWGVYMLTNMDQHHYRRASGIKRKRLWSHRWSTLRKAIEWLGAIQWITLLSSGRKTLPPSLHTHTCWTLWYYMAGCCYLHVGISILTEISDLSWWEIWGAKMPRSPLLQATGRPALEETSVKDPSCKSSSNKSAVNCVLPMEWDPQIVTSAMSVKLGCVCMVVFFTECHSIVNL